MPNKRRKKKFENDLKLFKEIAGMKKNKLQFFLYKFLKNYGYKDIHNTNNFLMAEGDLPVCLCAHMDTVFNTVPTRFFYDEEQTTVWSPGGMGADDRAGIVIILKLLEAGLRPSIIFTDLEEKGGIGADALVKMYGNCPFRECKAMIQLDRRGMDDSVYYNCANKDFEKKINSYGFKTDWGTFSDISVFAPIWKIAAVNLSVGYENEHTSSEYLNLYYMNLTYGKVYRMLMDCENWMSYSYIEDKANNYFSYFFQNGNKCICCGQKLKDYYTYQYDDVTYKLCPDCYAMWTCPGETTDTTLEGTTDDKDDDIGVDDDIFDLLWN